MTPITRVANIQQFSTSILPHGIDLTCVRCREVNHFGLKATVDEIQDALAKHGCGESPAVEPVQRPLPIQSIVAQIAGIQDDDGKRVLLAQVVILDAYGDTNPMLVFADSLPAEITIGSELLTRFEIRACRVCGCTSDKPCLNMNPNIELPTCSWVESDLCSRCEDSQVVLVTESQEAKI